MQLTEEQKVLESQELMGRLPMSMQMIINPLKGRGINWLHYAIQV